MPRFEQSSVQSCVPAESYDAIQSNYPWINSEVATIPTFLVTLSDDTQFRFGSLIGLNGTIEQISHSVSRTESSSAQSALFIGLPTLLKGLVSPGISRIGDSKLPNCTLFIASRNLASLAGLVFAVQSAESRHEPSIILKAGISNPSDQSRLLRVMGIRQPGGRKKRS